MQSQGMSYEELLERGHHARLRGNEELARLLFSRALESKRKSSLEEEDTFIGPDEENQPNISL